MVTASIFALSKCLIVNCIVLAPGTAIRLYPLHDRQLLFNIIGYGRRSILFPPLSVCLAKKTYLLVFSWHALLTPLVRFTLFELQAPTTMLHLCRPVNLTIGNVVIVLM